MGIPHVWEYSSLPAHFRTVIAIHMETVIPEMENIPIYMVIFFLNPPNGHELYSETGR